ncbi:TonB-dependent receptor [Lacibacter sp. H375]|uniref:SusC/RagA family TonB-linked outer membrane protein n=1 Tax=Lacibacter sp. H375 TaxID=3133424 RepID=UPI0030BA599F
MKQKLLLFFSLCLLLTLPVLAQNKTIKGTVTDATSNLPLAGVSVVAEGTTVGTTTNESGQFTLQVATSVKKLTITFVNYRTTTVDITEDNLSIRLTAEVKGMDEVVVVGYGTQKKKDLTGSVSTIGAKDVGGRQTVQVSEALQGSISGVSVTRSSGAPGSGASIRIRGITTTGENSPLILVDGVPVNSIDNVNPNDVESISVLKDAASAAIYGSRGAAGVVLVTTKRAKNGQSSLEYNYEYAVQTPTSLPSFVGVQDYMRYFNEQSVNDGASSGPYPQAFINSYLDSNKVSPDRFPNTDWQRATMKYRFAPRERHDLVFTMGTGKLKTKASLGYQNAGAFYDNFNYNRYLVRLNNDLQINDRISVNLDIAYRRTTTKSTVSTPGFGSPVYEGRVLPPIYDDYYSDGRYAPGKDGRNPLAQIYEGGFGKSTQSQLLGRLAINVKPIKDLTLTALISPSFDFDKNKTFAKQIRFTDINDPSRVIFTNLRSTTFLNEGRTENLIMNGQFLANYRKEIGKYHSIEALAGYEENYNYFESISASRDGFPLTTFPYLSVGSQEFRDNSGNASESALRSFFGRVNYSFNDRYFVQGNIRYDKSSRFGKNYRDAMFPSVSAGWVLSEETFLKDVKWLSFLKLRASYGEAGNERIGNYPYQASLAASTALFYQGTAVVPLTGYAQTDFAIEDISWETTSTTDVGVDMTLLNSRLTVTADYFVRRTRDILLISDIPNYVGFNDPYDNLGTIGAKGWELEIGWRDHFGKLNYSVAANLSDAKTEVITISNPGSLGSIVNLKGYEFNSWYGYRSGGIFQNAAEVAASPIFPNTKPGDMKYNDLNKDGSISSDKDREVLGGSLPRYIYGGNIRLDYQNFDFGLVFQGVGKKLSLLPSESIQPFAEAFGNMPSAMVGRLWSVNNSAEQNKAATFPRLSRTSNGNNYLVSDHWLVNGAYFRVKNITLGYNMKQALLKRAAIQSIRFYAAVNDLFSIHHFPKYIGADPEAANLGYPIVTTIMGGITVKF